jgi:dTDP-4-amino-4,6-dideoxygalactose transaminase
MKFNNLNREYNHFKNLIDPAVQKVMQSGKYLFGEQTEQLEQNFRGLTGKMHAISVKNATDAITMVTKYYLRKTNRINISNGIIVPAFGAYPTSIAVKNALPNQFFIGAVDVDDTLTIDTSKLLQQNINDKLKKLIVAVDLFGNEANIKKIKQDIPESIVIHDCAQATCYYRDYSLSDVVIFSFYPTKPLASMGDGGMICTDDHELSEWLYKHRFYGYEKDGTIETVGVNSRMDEIQAAILNVKFNHLPWMNQKRVEIANKYLQVLPFGTKPMKATQNCIYHQFPLMFMDAEQKNTFVAAMNRANIPHMVHYPKMVIELTGAIKNANNISERIISLPCHTFMTPSEIKKVVTFLKNFK